MSSEDELSEILTQLKLTLFAPALQQLGIETAGDLAYVQDADLEKLGMPMIQRRKLLTACGGEWRSAPPEEAAVAARPGTAPGRGVQDARHPVGGGEDEELLNAQEDMEVNQLLEEWRERVEDFSAANQLDDAARNALIAAEPYTALRSMGLIGSGNAFVMHGVRRPSAAVLSRLRNPPSGGGRPYQDWPKLLVGFASCNKLSGHIREQINGLGRDQALRVMGFTTGLRFFVPREGGDPDIEVAARVRAAVEGAPMVAVEPRTAASMLPPPPPAVTHGNSQLSPHRASQNSWQPPPQRPDSRMRSRSRSRGQRFNNHDIAPFWRANLEAFIQVNELDERSVQVLAELAKHDALRVMGLVGRSNSFVIRGARNTNAAVMHRIRAVRSGELGGGEEPYANAAKMVEDFIELNLLDDRGAEAVRALSKEEALHVLGFTAENTFVFRGVKNPSASVMARIQQARRFSRR